MSLKNQFFKVTSIISGGVSAIVGTIVFTEMVTSTFFDGGSLIGCLVAGTISGGSFYNAIRLQKQQKKELFQKKQLDILYLAVQHNGQLTPTQVALQTNTPIDETKELLDSLSDAGVMELQVSNRGNLVYTLIDEVYLQDYMEKIGQ
jgi:predicted transcriptional regulator